MSKLENVLTCLLSPYLFLSTVQVILVPNCCYSNFRTSCFSVNFLTVLVLLCCGCGGPNRLNITKISGPRLPCLKTTNNEVCDSCLSTKCFSVCLWQETDHHLYTPQKGGLDHSARKFAHIFVAVITFPPFLLFRYFYYQRVAYCVCFKMICEISL